MADSVSGILDAIALPAARLQGVITPLQATHQQSPELLVILDVAQVSLLLAVPDDVPIGWM